MFIVALTGSPHYRSTHYLQIDDLTQTRLVQRSRARATRYPTREAAEKMANRNWVNGFVGSVQEA